MKQNLCVLLMLLLFLFTQKNVIAQEEDMILGTEFTGDMVVVANVDMENGEIVSQDGRDFKIAFDLVNSGDTVQSGVQYSVRLSEPMDDPETSMNHTIDERVYNDVFSIDPGKRIHKEIAYSVPEVFSGWYEIMIYVQTEKGVPLAVSNVGTDGVTVEKVIDPVFLKDCMVVVEGDQERYNIGSGVDVSVDEALYVECNVENTGKDVNILPEFITHRRGVFGEKVGEAILQEEWLIGGEIRSMLWKIPLQNDPQAYTANLKLLSNDEIVSNVVPLHYVVRGESGSVLDVQSDKNFYTAGDIAQLSFNFAGRADLFMGSRAHGDDAPADTDMQEMYYNAEIRDKDGLLCGSVSDQKIESTFGLVEGSVEIDRTCEDPTVNVILSNKSGTVLDEARFSFDSGKEDQSIVNVKKNWMQMIFYGVLIVTVIGIIFIIIFRKKINRNIGVFIACVIIGYGLVFTHDAHALTLNVPPPAPWAALGTAMTVTAGAQVNGCNQTSTRINGTVTIKACSNAYVYGRIYVNGSNVYNKYCPKGSGNCVSGSSWSTTINTSRLGTFNIPVKAVYDLKDTKWDQEKSGTLSFSIWRCPECGTRDRNYSYTVTNWPSGSTWCNPGDYRYISGGSFPTATRPVKWKCTRNNGVYTTGTCTATKDAAPTPACGTRDRDYSYTTIDWPSSSSWCNSASSAANYSPSAAFPNAGSTTRWRCNSKYDSSYVNCEAKRASAPAPACGTREGNYAYGVISWPYGSTWCNSVSSATNYSPSTDFPDAGSTTRWRCASKYDSSYVNCEAKREDISCGSAHRSTYTSQPINNLCSISGEENWIDVSASDGTWNWKCGDSSCYAYKEDYSCTGGNPPYGATWCLGDTTGLTSNIPWQEVSACTNTRKCEYTVPSYSCTGGNPPYGATWCLGDTTGLTSNIPWQEVSACTNTRKCEYTMPTSPDAKCGSLKEYPDIECSGGNICAGVSIEESMISPCAVGIFGNHTIGSFPGDQQEDEWYCYNDDTMTVGVWCRLVLNGSKCGDGVKGGHDEECDDGNTDNGDGCDSSCQLENTCSSTYAKTYNANDNEWGTGTFCDGSATLKGDMPTFPEQGMTVHWTCELNGYESDCEASRRMGPGAVVTPEDDQGSDGRMIETRP